MQYRRHGQGIVRRALTIDLELHATIEKMMAENTVLSYSMAIGMLARKGADMDTDMVVSNSKRWPSDCPKCGAGVGQHCVSARTGKRTNTHEARYGW